MSWTILIISFFSLKKLERYGICCMGGRGGLTILSLDFDKVLVANKLNDY